MSKIIELAKDVTFRHGHVTPKIIDLAETGIYEQQDFITLEEWQGQTQVEVKKIIGTRHPDYIGMTWFEFLKKGKRMALNHQLFEENPGYYLSSEMKLPTMSYIEVDGNLYLDEDGNHRSCIAKFYFSSLGRKYLEGVTVRKIKIDHDAAKAYHFLQESLKQHPHLVLNKSRKHMSREDAPGWKKDHYEPIIQLKNTRTGSEMILHQDSVWPVIEILDSTTWLKKRFPRTQLETFLWSK